MAAWSEHRGAGGRGTEAWTAEVGRGDGVRGEVRLRGVLRLSGGVVACGEEGGAAVAWLGGAGGGRGEEERGVGRDVAAGGETSGRAFAGVEGIEGDG